MHRRDLACGTHGRNACRGNDGTSGVRVGEPTRSQGTRLVDGLAYRGAITRRMREAGLPADRGDPVSRLRNAAILAFATHLAAGLGMALVLRQGLEPTDLRDRLMFLVDHRWPWTVAWLAWTASALAILYFYMAFDEAHGLSARFAVCLTVAAIALDFSAQAVEIGVLPFLAAQLPGTNGTQPLFLTFTLVAIMLSGFLTNGLYSAAALLLTFSARRIYPAWISGCGFAVGGFGAGLSVAALLDSANGMVWANVFLVPTILLWLAAVALNSRIENSPAGIPRAVGE